MSACLPASEADVACADPAAAFATLQDWLCAELCEADLQRLIPADDPLRAWWQPAPQALQLDMLFELLDGSGDLLTVLALVQAVRERHLRADPPRALPPAVEQALGHYLAAQSWRDRTRGQTTDHDALVSYSHRDLARVGILVDWLGAAGVRIFQDVREIGPGDSITARLTHAIHHARHAIVMISPDYLQARWTTRELEVLLRRQRAGLLRVLPVLLDDIALPARLEGLFTIDLRGFGGDRDANWARPRLLRLLKILGKGAP